jgi:hypothetical protein
MTSFPPPPDFIGYQKAEWGSWGYERECTPEEAGLLEAIEAADTAARRAEEEERRDSWFAELREELNADRHPGPDPESR